MAMVTVKKGVRTRHEGYDTKALKWKRCRDVMAGQDAVHAAGEAYLPKLRDQDEGEYKAMVKRATFYNASWRTVSGLNGMLFRKEPAVDVPAGIKPHLDDITMSGVPFHMFAQEIALECLGIGRVGVLVDHPPEVAIEAGSVITVAQAQEAGLRPTMQMYRAETVINWKCRRVNNKHVLSMVVLEEDHKEPADEFGDKSEKRYRVLDLEPLTNQYRQRVFRINDRDEDEQVGEDIYPQMNGKPLDYIPFIFIGIDAVTPDLEDPPMIDLFDLNLNHYRVTADYEHGCHFTGLPTPVVSGYNPMTEEGKQPEKLYIGSAHAWVFPDPLAKATYLEFTGQGLSSLEKNLDRKEQQMAILGARMLAAEKKQAETATTSAIHRTGENSILSNASISISLGLTIALRWFAEWEGSAGECKCDINREFLPVTMDAPTLTALVSAWQAGAITEEELFGLLQRGDVIDGDADFEEHQAAAAAQAPPAPAIPKPGDPPPTDKPAVP